MKTMPSDDWQFWVVTAVAALALAFLSRGLIPKRWRRGRGGTKVTLTVRGKQ
ncbi:MAG: hypothetical protein RL689_769 [Planctomycetota bacterium]|jgi:hypothetical protein